jgi:putative hydrolase of the HAD superfamily
MHPADRLGGKGVAAQSVTGVVFDMGGVLTVDPYQGCVDYAIELGVPARAFADQFHGPQFGEVEVGIRSMRDFLKFVCTDVASSYGVRVDIHRLAESLVAAQEIRPEMIDLLAELADRQVTLGMLTNNSKEARAWWNSGVLPLQVFRTVIDSSDVGMRKPNPEIFAVTASRLGCEPGELLFFDDTEVNVAGAIEAGMVAHLFTTPELCRQTCVKHGLLAGRS